MNTCDDPTKISRRKGSYRSYTDSARLAECFLCYHRLTLMICELLPMTRMSYLLVGLWRCAEAVFTVHYRPPRRQTSLHCSDSSHRLIVISKQQTKKSPKCRLSFLRHVTNCVSVIIYEYSSTLLYDSLRRAWSWRGLYGA